LLAYETDVPVELLRVLLNDDDPLVCDEAIIAVGERFDIERVATWSSSPANTPTLAVAKVRSPLSDSSERRGHWRQSWPHSPTRHR
jgi:hypothetical protein